MIPCLVEGLKACMDRHRDEKDGHWREWMESRGAELVQPTVDPELFDLERETQYDGATLIKGTE